MMSQVCPRITISSNEGCAQKGLSQGSSQSQGSKACDLGRVTTGTAHNYSYSLWDRHIFYIH